MPDTIQFGNGRQIINSYDAGGHKLTTKYYTPIGTVVQQTEYYPSGTAYLEGTGVGVQPSKFTGKELILMHGLNWQDYGARWLDNVRMQWTTMDPLCEKYYAISPYTYCSDDPAKNIDPDGRNYYEDKNGGVKWIDGKNDIKGYANMGESFSYKTENMTITETNQKVTSITTNTMAPNEWVSQFSKPDWNGTPAKAACNKASDAMLAKAGVSSKGMEVIVNNAGNGRAGTANNTATSAISEMSAAIDQGKPTKVNVDYRNSSSSVDKMGDHFIVVQGKTEMLKNGQVTSTTFHYFDPGTHYINIGTSPSNTLNIMNRAITGYSNILRRNIVVTSIRPSE